MNDRGAVGVVALGLVLVGMALAVAIVDVSRVLAAASRAQAASDAAALAAAPVTFRPFGASGSARQEAAAYASANGARLVACSCPQDVSLERRVVTVRTEVVTRTLLFGSWAAAATGRAEFDPALLIDPPPLE